jgi:alkylation response protein AidB-like acyl-CoA dehydrogenase
MVDIHDTSEEAAFRMEVRAFLQEHFVTVEEKPRRLDPELGRTRDQATVRWEAALSSRGWLAPHWPKEYGGAGMSVTEQFIFNEEMAEARAPSAGSYHGLQLIGPVLIIHGTLEQKAEHLPRITSGEVTWCQGYSEPGAGSDLASLQTRAHRDGDEYVLNGQKIWTSGADQADWIFVLARTSPDAPKHRGISIFLVDMRTPGVSVRPIINMANGRGLCEVFLEDVRVPVGNLVGEENRGWYVSATLLDFERSNIGAAIANRHHVLDLVDFIHKEGWPTGVREQVTADELGERLIEAEVGQLLSYRIVSMQKRGLVPNYEASVNKMFYSELSQRVSWTGMKVMRTLGLLLGNSRGAAWSGRAGNDYVRTIPQTIAAGSSEIQRNIIATRGLGLPRS